MPDAGPSAPKATGLAKTAKAGLGDAGSDSKKRFEVKKVSI